MNQDNDSTTVPGEITHVRIEAYPIRLRDIVNAAFHYLSGNKETARHLMTSEVSATGLDSNDKPIRGVVGGQPMTLNIKR
ncbi:MAG: hypothetical protein H6867_06885 [Rhodospirillales bacterium]|nr:hypothetical protein [Rhodospirillales bacterium]MCB9995275.1 hypothetical protein [Rhodospirillales bacterium]